MNSYYPQRVNSYYPQYSSNPQGQSFVDQRSLMNRSLNQNKDPYRSSIPFNSLDNAQIKNFFNESSFKDRVQRDYNNQFAISSNQMISKDCLVVAKKQSDQRYKTIDILKHRYTEEPIMVLSKHTNGQDEKQKMINYLEYRLRLNNKN